MQLTQHERALLEQALSEVINHGAHYQKAMQYRGLLNKLQSMPHLDEQLIEASADLDGFRYDYDDNQ